MAKISHIKIKQPSFGEKRPKLTYTKISRFTVFRVYVLDMLSTSIHLRGNINCSLIYREDHLKRVSERVI